ncbi:MAG TPA: thioesterase domain-containing protein [Gemmatimonadaceae bacterium]|nr:thioesterase domain-containing protein [Gemmatimonadaceae bacterium]
MQSRAQSNPWILRSRTHQDPAVRLLYFPPGGAGASFAGVWRDQIPPTVDLCAIQLPARETRLKEPPIAVWHDLMDALVPALAPELDLPFALFGYSLGALVAFEFARALRRTGNPRPSHLFVAARPAPQLPIMGSRVAHLPDHQLLDTLRRAGMFPDAVADDRAFLEMAIPTWRMDLSLNEGYRYRAEPPFEFPISAFGGLSDPMVGRHVLTPWETHTANRFEVHMLPGGHMLPPESQTALMKLILKGMEPQDN